MQHDRIGAREVDSSGHQDAYDELVAAVAKTVTERGLRHLDDPKSADVVGDLNDPRFLAAMARMFEVDADLAAISPVQAHFVALRLIFVLLRYVDYDTMAFFLRALGQRLTPAENADSKERDMVGLYEAALKEGGGNKSGLARRIAAANEAAAKRGIPYEQRCGPTGSSSEGAVYQQLKRALKKRRCHGRQG